MNTRRAYVDLIYNGTAATAEISGFVTDISYTDPASGEADSLDITLQDRDHRWTGAWIPVAGAVGPGGGAWTSSRTLASSGVCGSAASVLRSPE